MSQGGVLALDLARNVGWAYGLVTDPAPICGVWALPRASNGARFAAFENELIDAMAVHRPGQVVVEAPMRLHAQVAKLGNEAAARQQYGLHAYAEGECHRAQVPIREADVTPVRDAVLGRKNWKIPGRDVKEIVVWWCQAQGWTVPDHNAADACILWQYAVSRAKFAGRARKGR